MTFVNAAVISHRILKLNCFACSIVSPAALFRLQQGLFMFTSMVTEGRFLALDGVDRLIMLGGCNAIGLMALWLS
jgi:hypothetical protein